MTRRPVPMLDQTLDELVAELLADVLAGLERRLVCEVLFVRWLEEHPSRV